jgi:hypothetical protein
MRRRSVFNLQVPDLIKESAISRFQRHNQRTVGSP